MGWHSRGSLLLVCAYCIVTAALLAWGALRFFHATEKNPCSMTYSRPAYRKIAVNSSATHYELLQYENGEKFNLEPHPVLFIPGSLGSYKQARSIGSVAARSKLLQLFALDFKDEPTAFHAHYVLQQAAFVNEAIATIRALYAANDVPVGPIVLVGHSYGGLAAKLSLLLTNHPPDSVDLVVMLSTPVMRPAFHPDASFELIYRTMGSIWKRSLADGDHDPDCVRGGLSNQTVVEFVNCAADVRNVILVSISGGDRDVLVRDGITKVAGPASNQSVSISSHELHRVQFGIDHKAILWCNQLVTAVVHGIHSWRRSPVERRNIAFWIEQLQNDAAKNATRQPHRQNQTEGSSAHPVPEGDQSSLGASFARMPYVEARSKADVAARQQRAAETMGVVGGSVYMAAVEHLPLVLTAFTAVGCWTLARMLLCQLLALPADFGSLFTLAVPKLSSILEAWIVGPLLLQQILPPPVAAYLLVKHRNTASTFGLAGWGVVGAGVAVVVGVGSYLSQLGATGVAILGLVLPYFLAFGVGILLWGLVTACFALLRTMFSPVTVIVRRTLRNLTSDRQGRVLRRKLQKTQWLGVIVPLTWFAVGIASYYLASGDSFELGHGGLQRLLLVSVSILFYTAYRTFCVQWFAMLLWPSSSREQAGYQLLLTVLYFPVAFLAYPTSTLVSRIFSNPHTLQGVHGLLLRDLAMYLLCLVAVIAHLHLARRKPLNILPVEQWRELVKAWTTTPAPSSSPATKGGCVHEDGGDVAIYEMSYDQCEKLAPGVYLGPMFRVVWCDCSRNRALPSAEYCDWCKCSRCGNRADRTTSMDQLRAFTEIRAAAIAIVCAAGFSILVPWLVGEYTFRNAFVAATMATLLVIHHSL